MVNDPCSRRQGDWDPLKIDQWKDYKDDLLGQSVIVGGSGAFDGDVVVR